MNLISRLFKLTYWPICRSYARYLGDRPADALFRCMCGLPFWKVHRYWPDFMHPRRFSEKVWSRMLFDRAPQWTLLSDKLRVRDYVASKVGIEYLVPLLWQGNNPAEIPFEKLPLKFVIKATHGCAYNIIVADKAQINPRKIRVQMAQWLSQNYCKDTYVGLEWGYKNIKPCIIIESFIEENGKPPVDYKFWCFSGRVEYLSLHFDRFEKHATRSFDRDFEPSEFGFELAPYIGKCPRPSNYQEMLQVAESLAGEFDFMRVDLYNVGSKIYFGELTVYPGGGFARFLPPRMDFVLGGKWRKK